METWDYKSLEWIHRVREENYNKTKNLSPKELLDETRMAVKDFTNKFGLRRIKGENK